jgi:cytochrome c
MDTMESTKILGSICAALLVFLLGGWAAEEIYHVGGKGHGHGDDHISGYPIEVAELVEVESDEPEMTLQEMMAVANPEKGEKTFSKCKACHKAGSGEHGTGPSMYQVVGRDIGSINAFEYSGAMASFGGVWDAESLNAFLIKPASYIKGTKMSFAGLKKGTDRANVIKYLETLQ